MDQQRTKQIKRHPYKNIMKQYSKQLLQKLSELSRKKEKVIIAIDGRCCSGKTTLAKKIQAVFSV